MALESRREPLYTGPIASISDNSPKDLISYSKDLLSLDPLAPSRWTRQVAAAAWRESRLHDAQRVCEPAV